MLHDSGLRVRCLSNESLWVACRTKCPVHVFGSRPDRPPCQRSQAQSPSLALEPRLHTPPPGMERPTGGKPRVVSELVMFLTFAELRLKFGHSAGAAAAAEHSEKKVCEDGQTRFVVKIMREQVMQEIDN